MERSKHPGDVAMWIIRIIKSCENPLQMVTAKKLMRQFMETYKDNNYQRMLINTWEAHTVTKCPNLIKED